MIIDVPVLNEDGSVKFSHTLDAKQVQALLQFALNFLTATGLSVQYGIALDNSNGIALDSDEKQNNLPFDD